METGNLTSSEELHRMLQDGKELAILDVRPGGIYAEGHLFYAASMPLSRLDFEVTRRIPRKDTRIVLIDQNGRPGGEAHIAHDILQNLGYSCASILDGGQEKWRGHVYAGVYTPSKAFGEVAEHHFSVPSISSEELASMAPPPLILDCRTYEEYQRMSIPGAYSCPGGELIRCALDRKGPIVVNCAGRTRSIMGALTLQIAGRDDVRALENGTMGQLLAGGKLEYGQTRRLECMTNSSEALRVAANLRTTYGLEVVSLQDAANIPGTCYLLDVRSPEQYARGHIAGFISAPGGQLVQQVDYWCPVLGASIVLCDADGLSATTTGIWLKLMGWEVKILLIGDEVLTAPSVHQHTAGFAAGYKEITVLDVGESRDYKKGHIPNSAWINRSDLNTYLADKSGKRIGITAKDIDFAMFVAECLNRDGVDAVVVERSELTTETPIYLSPRNDVWYPPHERDEGVDEAMREYLSWEQGLLDQVRTDDCVRFAIQ